MITNMLMAWKSRIRTEWLDYPLREGSLWAADYRIERYIGMGSYGQAYTVRDADDRLLLLKRNKPSKKELGLVLLRRESEILRALNHPQIPRWLGYTKHRGGEGLLMEYVEGSSLEDGIGDDSGRGIAYSELDALRIVRNLMSPLSHLHEAGFVHRDVRIPNVIVHEGQAALIDYGLACRIGEELPPDLQRRLGDGPEAMGRTDGSWNEVRRHMRRPHPASDLYGAGHLMLFLLYSGYQAEEGQEERSWEEELDLSPEGRTVVRRLLADERSGGWSSASECAAELDRLLAGR